MTRALPPAAPGTTLDRTAAGGSEARAVDALVSKILGWRTAPDRFIKPGRSWTPRSRFNPFTRLEDAFLLLERVGSTWVLSVDADRVFAAQICVGDRVGEACGDPNARTITMALCRALGIEVI